MVGICPVLSCRDLAETVSMVGPCTYRACYLGTALYICGFVILGAAFQMHLSIWALVMGWAISMVGTMVATVAICAFLDSHRAPED